MDVYKINLKDDLNVIQMDLIEVYPLEERTDINQETDLANLFLLNIHESPIKIWKYVFSYDKQKNNIYLLILRKSVKILKVFHWKTQMISKLSLGL